MSPPPIPPGPAPAGFCAGTRIMMLHGEVPVERIAAGDLALTLSGHGASLKPVAAVARWDCGPVEALQLVRIAAGAFAPGVPIRDLRLAAGTCLLTEDAHGRRGLVLAETLVNGATITHEPAQPLPFFSVGLAEHDILMADGMAAEADRGAAAPALPLLVAEAAHAVHAALMERAVAEGHALTGDPDLQLFHAGSAAERIASDDASCFFLLPPGAGRVELRSRSFVPAEADPAGGDRRRLGVAITRIVHDGIDIALAGPACAEGFLPAEGAGGGLWRWTTGTAFLALPALSHEATLEIEFRRAWGRYWLPPRSAKG